MKQETKDNIRAIIEQIHKNIVDPEDGLERVFEAIETSESESPSDESVKLIESLIQDPDVLIDAVQNPNTEWDARELAIHAHKTVRKNG